MTATSYPTAEFWTTFVHHRSRIAALSRDRAPNDPELLRARESLLKAQQTIGADLVLSAVEHRNANEPDRMVERLKPPAGVPMAVLLLEAVEMLAYIARATGQPRELLAALRQQVTDAS